MKIKVSEASGATLDWLVAKCEGVALDHGLTDDERYSTNWAQGGPIIEREAIQLTPYGASSGSPKSVEYWCAAAYLETEMVDTYGLTPLIAAMRCYVASKLGDEVEVPEELA